MKVEENLVSLFKPLLEELTLKKIRNLCVILVILLGLFVLFESYTSYFRFSRLEAAATLYQKAYEIDSAGTNYTAELDATRKNLIGQINDAIVTKPISLQIVPSTLTLSMDTMWKFLAGATLPAIAFLYFLINFRTNLRNKVAAEGAFLLALISGFVGIFVKGFRWPVFHIFILPILVGVSIIVVSMLIALIAGNKINKAVTTTTTETTTRPHD